MTSVYDQHRAHTKRTTACAVLKDGQHVANVTIAHPKDGAGRLYAYVHWLGTEMVRGSAGGYGYDKCTAAVSRAAEERLKGWSKAGVGAPECMFWEFLALDDGHEWYSQLHKAGFTVCSVC